MNNFTFWTEQTPVEVVFWFLVVGFLLPICFGFFVVKISYFARSRQRKEKTRIAAEVEAFGTLKGRVENDFDILLADMEELSDMGMFGGYRHHQTFSVFGDNGNGEFMGEVTSQGESFTEKELRSAVFALFGRKK